MLCPPLMVAGSIAFYSVSPEQPSLTILGASWRNTWNDDNHKQGPLDVLGPPKTRFINDNQIVQPCEKLLCFWKRARLEETDIAPLLGIVTSLEFLAYIKRTPRDIRMLMKANFKPQGTKGLELVIFPRSCRCSSYP